MVLLGSSPQDAYQGVVRADRLSDQTTATDVVLKIRPNFDLEPVPRAGYLPTQDSFICHVQKYTSTACSEMFTEQHAELPVFTTLTIVVASKEANISFSKKYKWITALERSVGISGFSGKITKRSS